MAHARLLALYIATGLSFMLLPGTFLGVWNLLQVSARQSVGLVSASWLQAHGHAQIFGWVGLFVTMINLLPWGQLDGGHIAFALLGPIQNRIARLVRWAVLGFFLYNLLMFVGPVLTGRSAMPLSVAIGNSLTWLVWYGLLGLLERTMGQDHPPVEPAPLSPTRRRIAKGCLALFVLLFMPTPLANYTPADDSENLSSSAEQTAGGTYRLMSPR